MTMQYFTEESLAAPAPVSEIQSNKSRVASGKIVRFIVTVQLILLLAHWFVYQTWVSFRGDPDPPGATAMQVVLFLLSLSFVGASLLGHRYSNFGVRLLYRIAVTWLGFFNYFFFAACVSWASYSGSRLLGIPLSKPMIADSMFGLAVLVSIYGVINARWVRVKSVAVKLLNLPATWRGRVAALVSDVPSGTLTVRDSCAVLSRSWPNCGRILFSSPVICTTAARWMQRRLLRH